MSPLAPPCRYRVTQAFAEAEGWGIPGDLPTRDNNPLDLRHSPHSSHAGEAPDEIGEIDTIAHGWQDGDRQMELWAGRGLTLGEAMDTQLGIMRGPDGLVKANPDNNPWSAYWRIVLRVLNSPDALVSPQTAMTDVVKIPAV